MKEILFKETTTLGVRYYPLTVHRLERMFKQASTEWGPYRKRRNAKWTSRATVTRV